MACVSLFRLRPLVATASMTGAILCRPAVMGRLAQPAYGAVFARSVGHMASYRSRKKAHMKKVQADPGMVEAMQKHLEQYQQENPYRRDSLGQIVDTYVPPEPSQKLPIYTSAGIAQRWERTKMVFMSFFGMGVVKKNLPGFKPVEFAQAVEQQYNKINLCLASNDTAPLKDLTTGDMYLDLVKEAHARNKGKRGAFEVVQTLERPRVVHCRVVELEQKKNYWAQLTVRIAQRQRYSNASFNKKAAQPESMTTSDVIDYVVVERHLMNANSQWRIAGKIVKKPE